MGGGGGWSLWKRGVLACVYTMTTPTFSKPHTHYAVADPEGFPRFPLKPPLLATDLQYVHLQPKK